VDLDVRERSDCRAPDDARHCLLRPGLGASEASNIGSSGSPVSLSPRLRILLGFHLSNQKADS